VPEALLLKFVAHHLWDPEKRGADPGHGMPKDVDESLRRQNLLKSTGPQCRRQPCAAGWRTGRR